MKKVNSPIAIFVFIFIAFFSCKNENNKSIVKADIQLEGLTLNNNEKWVANEETHIGMKRIDSILKNNTSANGKALGDKLSKETSYIIKSCDMKGEAHDQLHIVLVPILKEISEIKDVKNTIELEKKTRYLKQLITTYFEYFKT